ncbi:MAG: MmcQ/YjbR family DNA-binding protein [Gemmataceae bacterium]
MASNPKQQTTARSKKLSSLILGLPKSTSEPYGDHTKYIVGKKTFVYFMNNHHNCGIIGIWCKNTVEEQQRLVSLFPEMYFIPPYVGPNGWVGFRLDQPNVDWDEVFELVLAAYRLQAPKKLLEELA